MPDSTELPRDPASGPDSPRDSTRNPAQDSPVCSHLSILVSDPQKQRADQVKASSSYVTYQISTKIDNRPNPAHRRRQLHIADKSKKPTDIIVVHRRYSDFVLLHTVLTQDHPSCIVPPLPDKKVLQYIAGDRFGHSFTQKRCHSLQNFLRRISEHPVLSQSRMLETFLVSSDWDAYRRTLSGTLVANKEEVSDALMNAFKTVHNQSEEFTEIKEKSEKLDHNVSKIDKIFHRVVKRQEAISDDFGKFSQSLRELQELVSDGSESDKALCAKVKTFNEGISQLSYGLRDVSKYLDYEYIVDLKDMEHYIDNVKQTIKLKDQKQIDYEELNDYLTKSINEKNNLVSGYGGSNYFASKLEELAGINQEVARRDKISKLETKIGSLTTEVENAKEVADAFEREVLKEVNIFEGIKTKELKSSLTALADNQIEFYQKMVDTWSKVEQGL
ncbi:LAMI_0F12222g1_1 [Lachancea mirantina]|uniref:Sorting nexin-4 n=1 Tax=Lachancea mirantina TaxID=1230905 RepID=A0A1G4K2S9_9SACH|nr:LAMI_0F12222g1_1 [Lachancea mirantina]